MSTTFSLLGCTSNGRSDGDILAECWGAVPTHYTRQYRAPIDAVIFRGIEARAYALSTKCPNYRLQLNYDDPIIQERFERATESIVNSSIPGIGIHANVRFSIYRRKDEYHLVVKLHKIFEWRVMSQSETNQVMRRFSIAR